MFANWPKGKITKNKSINDVKKIISIISKIRSFKNELNVSPGSYIDLSLEKIKPKNKSFFKNNDIILKKLGRINNFYKNKQNKSAATIVIDGDIFKLYFDQGINLELIKENLNKRQNKYQLELNSVSLRLDNKDFIKRAPKNIVDQEKINYNKLKNDIDKISLIIKNL